MCLSCTSSLPLATQPCRCCPCPCPAPIPGYSTAFLPFPFRITVVLLLLRNLYYNSTCTFICGPPPGHLCAVHVLWNRQVVPDKVEGGWGEVVCGQNRVRCLSIEGRETLQAWQAGAQEERYILCTMCMGVWQLVQKALQGQLNLCSISYLCTGEAGRAAI